MFKFLDISVPFWPFIDILFTPLWSWLYSAELVSRVTDSLVLKIDFFAQKGPQCICGQHFTLWLDRKGNSLFFLISFFLRALFTSFLSLTFLVFLLLLLGHISNTCGYSSRCIVYILELFYNFAWYFLLVFQLCRLTIFFLLAYVQLILVGYFKYPTV